MICCLQPEPDRLSSHGVAQPRGDYSLATKGTRHRWGHPHQPQCCYHSQTPLVAVPQPEPSLALDTHSQMHLSAFLQPTPGWGTEPWGGRLTGHPGEQMPLILAQGADSQSDSRSTAKYPSTPPGTFDVGSLNSAKETYLLTYLGK